MIQLLKLFSIDYWWFVWQVSFGDFISIKPEDVAIPVYIAMVNYLWENASGNKMCHVQWLWWVPPQIVSFFPLYLNVSTEHSCTFMSYLWIEKYYLSWFCRNFSILPVCVSTKFFHVHVPIISGKQIIHIADSDGILFAFMC